MIFPFYKHQKNQNQALGFWPSRLLYQEATPRPGDVEPIPEAEVEERDLKAEQERWERVRKAWEEMKAKNPAQRVDHIRDLRTPVKKAVDEYNQFMATAGFNVSTHLQFDPNNPETLIQEITRRLTLIRYSDEIQKRYQLIKSFAERYRDYKDAEKEYQELVKKHGDRVLNRGRVVRRNIEKKAEYKERPVYQEFSDLFESIVDNDKEAQSFFFTEREGYSEHRLKGMRQLFFTLLSDATNEFRDNSANGFILGADFKDDFEANRQAQPFIYHEWLTHERADLAQGIEDAQTKVDQLSQDKDVKITIEALIDSERPVGGRPLVENRVVTRTEAEVNGLPAAERVMYHTERIEGIKHLKYEYGRLVAEEEAKPKPDTKAMARYREKAKKLEKHVEYEEALVKLHHQKAMEADVRSRFTRTELAKDPRWLMRTVMKQFQRAVEIVDQPIPEGGSLRDQYNPAVRRMLIAQIYKDGVSGFRGETRKNLVYQKDVAHEYYYVLATLTRSPHFNRSLTNEFVLSPAAKQYLSLAFHGSLLNLEIPLQEKRIEAIEKRLKEMNTSLGAVTPPVAHAPAHASKFNEVSGLRVIDGAGNLDLDGAFLSQNYQGRIQTLENIFIAAAKAPIDALKATIDAPAAAVLHALTPPIDPDAAIAALPAEQTKAEDYLIALAKQKAEAAKTDAVSRGVMTATDPSDFDKLGSDRAKQIELGIRYAQAINNTDPLFSQYHSILLFLDYSRAAIALNKIDESTAEGRAELIKRGRALGQGDPKSPAGLAVMLEEYVIAQEKLRIWKNDSEQINLHLKDINTPAAQQFLRDFKADPTLEGGTNQEWVTRFETRAGKIERDYMVFDRREKSQMDYFNKMGLKLEGIKLNYDNYIKDPAHKDMTIDQWERYFNNQPGYPFEKLVEMLRVILPDKQPGKLDFLIAFEGLHTQSAEPWLSEEHKMVIQSLYMGIREHLEHREQLAGAEARKDQELKEQLRGMNIGERVTKYATGVLDMIIGSGQPIANRAAGMVLAIMAYKAAKSALKGETTGGKMMRMLFLAGALEIGMKEITGRGFIDRANVLDSMGKAIEGTYEAVLVQQGADFMKSQKIKKEEHIGALFELKDVPFHVVMDWYKNTTESGQDRDGGEGKALWRKMKINVNRVRANRKLDVTAKNRELEARFIVKKTVEHFFRYVASKEHHREDANTGQKALEERWVKDVQDPTFDKDNCQYATFLEGDLAERFRGNQNDLTWAMVRAAEIDPDEVKRTVGQDPVSRLVDYGLGKLSDLETWTRDKLDQYINPAATAFFGYLGEKADDAKDLLVKLHDAGFRKLHFTAERAELWYGANKVTLRRFAGEHVDLLWEGIKAPFQIVFALDKKVVHWALAKVRQTREILRDDKLTIFSGRELLATDIIPAGVTGADILERDKNDQFDNFGYYSEFFRRAYQAGYDATGKRKGPEAAFHENGHIGYYITETTLDDIGGRVGKSTEAIYDEMDIKAWAQAKERMMRAGVDAQDVDKFMYSIHVVAQASPGSSTPAKVYKFWRMPLKGSEEYELKSKDRWADYMDPNEHKYRPPFEVDSTVSTVENLKRAYGVRLEGPREAATTVAKYAVQWLRLVLGTVEASGSLIKFIDKYVPGKRPGLSKTIDAITKFDEKNLQLLDEVSGSAEDAGLAISDFYKNQHNADLFKAAKDKAYDKRAEINLAEVTGWTRVRVWHKGRPSNETRLNPSWFNGR